MSNRIYFFPKYSSKGPSSRYRIYNFLEYYKENGFLPIVYPLFDNWYLECIWKHESRWKIFHKILWAYIKRVFILFFLPSNSKIYIGTELFPYLPFGFEYVLSLKRIKYIIEFDDAIFHYYDKHSNKFVKKILGNKTEKVIAKANYVITGSEYLTKYAEKHNNLVAEIPTSVDEYKYSEMRPCINDDFVIGWIGSVLQSRQLLKVIPALKLLGEEHQFKLHLIGFDKNLEYELNNLPYEIIEWNDKTEITEMCKFSVGIMPLDNSDFSKGKCAFKLVQYMAIGIPTISTPLQSNININKDSGNLFAENIEEWVKAFKEIKLNREKYHKIGLRNQIIAMNNYTIQSNFMQYLEIFKKM